MSDFFLTRRAVDALYEIEHYSSLMHGDKRTALYMDDLYKAFAQMALQPESGELRQYRSFPFLMAPAEKHFAVYKTTETGIIIATLLHGRQNIETILEELAPALMHEILALEKKLLN